MQQSPTDVFSRGERIGPYEIVRELGRGGMGRVYLTEDTAVGGRPVALKVILGAALAEDDEAYLRFEREIRNLGRIRHPNIVTVFTAGRHGGHPYFVMDFVDGRDLAGFVDELRSLAPVERERRIVRVMAKVARAIHAAHEQRIVHRDLKPTNILVARKDDEPVVLDFGIAKNLGDESLTRGPESPGTPAFRAPEQIDSRKKGAEERVDVWALGVILYRVLTGRLPFVGEDLVSVSFQILEAAPPPPRSLAPGLSPALESLVLACLEKDPAARPASARAVADALERFLRGVPDTDAEVAPTELLGVRSSGARGKTRAPPARRAAVAGIVAALVLSVGAFLTRSWWWPAPAPTSGPPGAPAAGPSAPVETPRATEGAVRVPAWARSYDALPDEDVVIFEALRARIKATGLAWRVRDDRLASAFVVVPPGQYFRGADESVEHAGAAERPAHPVTLTRPFYVACREVTQAEWEAVMGTNPSRFGGEGRGDHPVESVGYREVQEFLRKTGTRLPTEAEWEWFARCAGDYSTWAELSSDDWNQINAGGTTQPAGAKRANPLGLHDVMGNVSEWCSDAFSPAAYEELVAGVIDPKGPPIGAGRAVRGANYLTFQVAKRLTVRFGLEEGARQSFVGFRVVRDP